MNPVLRFFVEWTLLSVIAATLYSFFRALTPRTDECACPECEYAALIAARMLTEHDDFTRWETEVEEAS